VSLVPDIDSVDAWSDRLMRGAKVPRPGPVYGAYPMRAFVKCAASPMLAWLQGYWRAAASPKAGEDRRFIQDTRRAELQWQAQEAITFSHKLVALRVKLGTQGFDSPLAAQSFGLICAAVRQHKGLALHDVQLLAARWMLGQRLVEMATGEGKTLTVLLSAATAALSGVPVHVLTANDYLARRDAEELAAIYATLGLTVSHVEAASTPDERQRAYQADVVYVTAKEVAFDHLRDRAARAVGHEDALVLRGLCMAVIDEADSILIDEACMPLILAAPTDVRAAEQRYRLALFLARQLKEDVDFRRGAGCAMNLTTEGEARLMALSSHLKGEWLWRKFRQAQVTLALQALHGFQRDVHYLVRDNEVHIIDEVTGRLAIGRSWSRGLHQMIAIKESVPPVPENETLSQSSYQTLLPRYLRLAGLSGTLYEDRHELLRIYGLPVCRVPLRVPSRREVKPLMVCGSQGDKWRQVASRARDESSHGRPVLIGTDTVADSEALSAELLAQGVPHQVLNARQDGEQGHEESAVIARAGECGCITVATHMAGRGTDIRLSDEALAHGGLHVINTNLNRSRRIDRQLIGRCARQGTPGSCETILAWDDRSWREFAAKGLLASLVGLMKSLAAPAGLSQLACQLAQRSAEARAREQRWQMLQTELQVSRQLALAGREDWA
jgi:preprotein translocase subunit SecA